jgi:hypothetical protein
MPVLAVQGPSQAVVVVQTTVANVTGGGGGGGAPSAHASTHQSGGSDALALGSIAGSLTLAQHGTLGTGDPHPQYATDTDVATVQTNVDNLAAGMRFKDSVRVATTANINIANPGTAIDRRRHAHVGRLGAARRADDAVAERGVHVQRLRGQR